ncbi:MAG: YajQ family cyclic di-GMP-binding protein [Cyanobacteria bacterium]|nr:YajQ family cyclic di-GMP-binding protein [Cyanobacteriota bacterium]
MAKEASFDVVSDFDQQELVNALDQARREVDTRYDLKDKGNELSLDEGKQITMLSPDEYSLSSLYDILATKVAKRGLNPMILEPGKIESALGGSVRQVVKLKRGIETDLAKKIVAEIKNAKLKVQPSIQGDHVRVSAKSIDDLQTVIQLLKTKTDDWAHPLQFTNYR